MSKIEDEDLMRTCLAAMMAAEQNDLFKESLLAVYDAILPLEEGHEYSTEKLRKQLLTTLNEKIEEIPMTKPEEMDMEEMSKCFTAVLWCHRTVEFVQHTENMLQVMASLHDIFQHIQEAQFQEDNT